MNANAYSEDQMLQAGTAEFFEEHLGWRTEFAFDREDYGPASLLRRAHRGEAVLVRELRQALKKLNPKAPAAAIEAAIQVLVADRYLVIGALSCPREAIRVAGCGLSR